MPAIALRVFAALAPLAQHLAAYAQLGAAAVGEYRSAWIRRVCFAVAAFILGMAGLAATWMIGLAAYWDTQWRMTYVIASAAVLLLLAIIFAGLALSKLSGGRATGLLREELNKDRELLQQWTRTL